MTKHKIRRTTCRDCDRRISYCDCERCDAFEYCPTCSLRWLAAELKK